MRALVAIVVATIDHNLFQMGVASTKGIDLISSSNVIATNNIFMGLGSPFAVSSSSVSTDTNYCDPNGGNSNCADCRTAGHRDVPHTPFLFP